MSSDYRPRGGGGGRRRRGGRGRSGHGHHGHSENRVNANGHSGSHKKKPSFIDKLLGWFKPKKNDAKPVRTGGRPDFKERDREPRADRPERSERTRAKADPTPQEITSTKLYVGNLAYEAAESDLFDLFSKVGKVKNVEIAKDRNSHRSKGFGFVEMEVLESAKEAAEKLNRTDFMGRQIVVSGAKVDKRAAAPREEADSASQEAGGSTESNI